MSGRDGGAAHDGAVHLVVEATVADDVLTLSFGLENRTPDPILAYLHPDDGERAAVLPGAYVCVAGTPPELRVLLGVPPVPRHFFVDRAVIPLARKIEARGSYQGRLEFDVPVREWSPYRDPAGPEGTPDDEAGAADEVLVDHGILQVEYFRASRVLWSGPGPVDGTVWGEGEERLALRAHFTLPGPTPTLLQDGEMARW